jgi:hypothetical protein
MRRHAAPGACGRGRPPPDPVTCFETASHPGIFFLDKGHPVVVQSTIN